MTLTDAKTARIFKNWPYSTPSVAPYYRSRKPRDESNDHYGTCSVEMKAMVLTAVLRQS